MVTDSAQKRALAFAQPPQGFVDRASRRARQFVCGLSGHDSLLHFQRGRHLVGVRLVRTRNARVGPGGAAPAHHERGASQSVQVPLVGQRARGLGSSKKPTRQRHQRIAAHAHVLDPNVFFDAVKTCTAGSEEHRGHARGAQDRRITPEAHAHAPRTAPG